VYSSKKKNRGPWLEVVVEGENDLPPGPLLDGPFYFAEYGSANRIDWPNTDIVDWCMDAWLPEKHIS
jgi:hypothetical protein